MKIRITQDAKQWLTVAEMPLARQIIEEWKDENGEDYARMAARIAGSRYGNYQILKSDFEIAGNSRRNWDCFGRLDVWMHVYAYDPYYGFLDFGAYLSDVISLAGDENRDEIRSHMYIRKFEEVKN